GRGQVALSAPPGRRGRASAAWASRRKPLVGEFRWFGRPLFVIANHFNSKGGDDPLFGHRQPPVFGSGGQRRQQAGEVRSFVDSILAVQQDANVVVLGDLNDFDFSQTADILVGSGGGAMTDLPRTLPLAERYTYDFQGNSEVLDHILLSGALVSGGHDSAVAHATPASPAQPTAPDPQVARLPPPYPSRPPRRRCLRAAAPCTVRPPAASRSRPGRPRRRSSAA